MALGDSDPMTNPEENVVNRKRCPKCAEEIKIEAEICRFCGYDLVNSIFVSKADTPRRASRSLQMIGAAILVAALVVTGGIVWASNRSKSSDEPNPAKTYSMEGTLSADDCGGGYEIEYASVDVRDQNDKLIGSATTSGDTGSGFGCEVDFDVEVPKATYYQVTVGTHGGPSYSFEELQAQNWRLDLTL
jgi:hypothetical protein